MQCSIAVRDECGGWSLARTERWSSREGSGPTGSGRGWLGHNRGWCATEPAGSRTQTHTVPNQHKPATHSSTASHMTPDGLQSSQTESVPRTAGHRCESTPWCSDLHTPPPPLCAHSTATSQPTQPRGSGEESLWVSIPRVVVVEEGCVIGHRLHDHRLAVGGACHHMIESNLHAPIPIDTQKRLRDERRAVKPNKNRVAASRDVVVVPLTQQRRSSRPSLTRTVLLVAVHSLYASARLLARSMIYRRRSTQGNPTATKPREHQPPPSTIPTREERDTPPPDTHTHTFPYGRRETVRVAYR